MDHWTEIELKKDEEAAGGKAAYARGKKEQAPQVKTASFGWGIIVSYRLNEYVF